MATTEPFLAQDYSLKICFHVWNFLGREDSMELAEIESKELIERQQASRFDTRSTRYKKVGCKRCERISNEAMDKPKSLDR